MVGFFLLIFSTIFKEAARQLVVGLLYFFPANFFHLFTLVESFLFVFPGKLNKEYPKIFYWVAIVDLFPPIKHDFNELVC